jgi:hypothetical protein
MKIGKLIFAALLSAAGMQAVAQDYKSAVGLRIAGDGYAGGLGINYKQFLSSGNKAIDLTLRAERVTAFSGLYQIHQQIKSEQSLQWHYGLGAFMVLPRNNVGIGAMGNLGLEFTFKEAPINIGFDWRPELLLAPTLDAEFGNIGLSIRFVIKR